MSQLSAEKLVTYMVSPATGFGPAGTFLRLGTMTRFQCRLRHRSSDVLKTAEIKNDIVRTSH